MLRALVAIAIAVATGCGALGTDDVELRYRYTGDPRIDTVAYLRQRLEAAGLYADVELDGIDFVRVRVDARRELDARRVLEWSGRLEIYALAPDAKLEFSVDDLTRAGDHFTGDDDAVIRAALDARDRAYRLVATRRSDGARAEIVALPPVAISATAPALARGTTVVVPFTAAARDALTARDGPGHEVLVVVAASNVFVRGHPRAWLADDDLGPVLVLPCGGDLRAYAKARRLASMLSTSSELKLRLIDHDAMPTQWVLALASTAIPLVTGLLWLAFVRRFDRSLPEPIWLVLVTFGLGALAQWIAGFIELHAWAASPYLDTHALALDHRASAFPLSYLACALVVGVIEEGAKLIATLPAQRRREFDEPIDGIVYAAAAAIGFAVAENISYFTEFRLDDITTVSRTLLTIPGHVLLSSVWGYALGQRLVRRRRARLAVAFAIAALAHAAYDTLLEFELRDAAYAVDLALAVTFAIVVRRSLRWGRLPSGDDATRVLIRVGRPAGAVMAFATMIGMAYLLRLHAAAAYANAERITPELAARGAVLVVLFGAAALALVRLLPLDVAIDERGVTYAGALYAWPEIRAAVRHRSGVVLDTGRGAVRIGPAGDREAGQLVDRVTAKLAARTSPGDSAAGA